MIVREIKDLRARSKSIEKSSKDGIAENTAQQSKPLLEVMTTEVFRIIQKSVIKAPGGDRFCISEYISVPTIHSQPHVFHPFNLYTVGVSAGDSSLPIFVLLVYQ
ncbi:MAG: hypothetical protein VB111_08185 [Clostridiaceae bacterium]|nr:hypothetical protein [Clostridiaceae bacterium]